MAYGLTFIPTGGLFAGVRIAWSQDYGEAWLTDDYDQAIKMRDYLEMKGRQLNSVLFDFAIVPGRKAVELNKLAVMVISQRYVIKEVNGIRQMVFANEHYATYERCMEVARPLIEQRKYQRAQLAKAGRQAEARRVNRAVVKYLPKQRGVPVP